MDELVTVVALVVLLCSGCVARPVPPVLRPGESAIMPVEGSGEATAETPRLQLNIEVTDLETGQRVNEAVIAIDGQVLAQGCCASIVQQWSTL